MTDYQYIECLGYKIFNGKLDSLITSDKLLINTINQYSFCVAEKDQTFKAALQKSDILLPDGIGIVAAAKFLKGKKIKKIAGADLHEFFLRKLNKESGSCFYLGSSEITLKKIEARLSVEYPNIRMGAYSPPFKSIFSKTDNEKMINAVSAFEPDVLFVGMTAPKQEKWSYNHKDLIKAKYICAIGAVFDFYAGTVERPNHKWQNLGLEWLGRLMKEPKRMWRRYVTYGGVFTFYLLRAKFKRILGKKNDSYFENDP